MLKTWIARASAGVIGIGLLIAGSWMWYLYTQDVDVDSFISPLVQLGLYGTARTYFNFVAFGVLGAAGFFLVQWAWNFKQKRPR